MGWHRNGVMPTMSTNNTTTELRDDLLNGAAEIGGYLGWNVRKVYHAAEKGYLPIGKCGAILTARKSELQRALSAENAA
jgi:hypothetical protein